MQHDAIPKYNIMIGNERLEKFQSNVWNEEPVPSKLEVDNVCYDLGITYRGDHIREFRKKSYRIEFGQYNDYFEAIEVHLNAEYCDPSLIRNKLALDFFQTLGILSPKSKHVFIELNGNPQGIYLQLESVDDFFLRKRQLEEGAIFYAINYNANFSLLTPEKKPKKSFQSGYMLKVGNMEDNLHLEKLIKIVNTTPRSCFGEEIKKYIDVNKYLLWLCGVICTQNNDGFIHNYALYRNGKTGLFEMSPWDFDGTWGRDINGDIMEYDYVPIEGYNTLTARLLDVKEYRNQYRLILEHILETSFTVEALEPKIRDLYNHLRPYLCLDPYKKNLIDKFDQEPEFILRFVVDRNRYLRNHLKDLL